jgi:hypothetical protein
MQKLIILSATILGLLTTSCNKNPNNTDPIDHATIAIGMKATNGGGGQNEYHLSWSSCIANVSHARFEGKLHHVRYITQTDVTGPIDLYAPVPIANSTFTIPVGPYQQATLSINLSNTNTYPAMLLHGSYAENASLVPVDLIIDQDLVLNTEFKNVTVTNNTVTAFTTLDMEYYSGGVTAEMLESAETSIGGNVIISSTSNKPIYDIIVNNLSTKRASLSF